MKDEGQRTLLGATRDGQVRAVRARVADVRKGLISIHDLVSTGHRVVFDDHEAFCLHKESGRRTEFKVTGHSYDLELAVFPFKNAVEGSALTPFSGPE